MLGEFRRKLKSLKKDEGWDGSAIIHASLAMFFSMTHDEQKLALRNFRVSMAEEKSK